MSRFKVGQKVWMGRGKTERELVVAVVKKNPFIPIRQYGFEAPHDGFLCGEQSIRAERGGLDLRMSECFVDDDQEGELLNIFESLNRGGISMYSEKEDADMTTKIEKIEFKS